MIEIAKCPLSAFIIAEKWEKIPLKYSLFEIQTAFGKSSIFKNWFEYRQNWLQILEGSLFQLFAILVPKNPKHQVSPILFQDFFFKDTWVVVKFEKETTENFFLVSYRLSNWPDEDAIYDYKAFILKVSQQLKIKTEDPFSLFLLYKQTNTSLQWVELLSVLPYDFVLLNQQDFQIRQLLSFELKKRSPLTEQKQKPKKQKPNPKIQVAKQPVSFQDPVESLEDDDPKDTKDEVKDGEYVYSSRQKPKRKTILYVSGEFLFMDQKKFGLGIRYIPNGPSKYADNNEKTRFLELSDSLKHLPKEFISNGPVFFPNYTNQREFAKIFGNEISKTNFEIRCLPGVLYTNKAIAGVESKNLEIGSETFPVFSVDEQSEYFSILPGQITSEEEKSAQQKEPEFWTFRFGVRYPKKDKPPTFGVGFSKDGKKFFKPKNAADEAIKDAMTRNETRIFNSKPPNQESKTLIEIITEKMNTVTGHPYLHFWAPVHFEDKVYLLPLCALVPFFIRSNYLNKMYSE
jgi:hypothetical protein